ncbi:hypothetical protein PTSG_10449 [Salpingoeca rosetta]|uniref:Uncharacterized protein n=1 Tax=Salpingoeca rosetta (strain ATCC 50818 / BSB-021) TaxID=946362 RepID=F2UPP6_SALR5|nr:uncharacterized protein PTSG_10449 [Salpingoeca rosetta]EGD79601.1 hypothetical protein PTSG_10449 [Salpingoeca rosetta]|eukprot:XP_004988829.1 hypothetical protein PTSG_10449 [Salpingoeca rosetta]
MMDKNGKGGRGEDAPLREMDTVPLDDDIDDDEEDEEEDFATPPAQPTTPAQQQEHEQEHEQKQKKEPASSAKAPARKKNPSSSGGSRGSSSSSGGHDPASGMAFHQQDDPHDADFEALPNVVKVKKEYEGHMGSTLGQSRQQTFTLPLGVAFPASEASTAPPISTEMDPSAPSPGENPNPYPYDANKHPLCKRIVDFLATEHLEGKTWKGGKSKTEIPKMALAKLLRGTKHDRKEVSEYFDSLSGPWGTMGSKHPLNSSGDYDYTAIGLAFILLNFDDAALPREIKYIIATRLMPPNATDPVLTVPKSLVSVLETENHLLMLNGSLYLFNLYATRARLAQPVDVSGLKSFLYVLLKEILRAGPWAYNSRPFLGHFIIALLVLHESCEPDFRHLCSKVLDFLVFCFALGSIDFRRRAPFRRKADHAGKPGLMDNALSAMSLVWAERAGIRHTAQSTDPRFLPISDKAIYAIAASCVP